jgi:hypothetical protein
METIVDNLTELSITVPSTESTVPSTESTVPSTEVPTSEVPVDLERFYQSIPVDHIKYYLNADLSIEFTLPEGVYELGTALDKMIISKLPNLYNEIFEGFVVNELFDHNVQLVTYLLNNVQSARVNKMTGSVTDEIAFNPTFAWVNQIVDTTTAKPEELCWFIRRETMCNIFQMHFVTNVIQQNDVFVNKGFVEEFREKSLLATDFILAGQPISEELINTLVYMFKEISNYNKTTISAYNFEIDNSKMIDTVTITT